MVSMALTMGFFFSLALWPVFTSVSPERRA